MSRHHITTAITFASAALALPLSTASAQMMPGGQSGGGMQSPGGSTSDGVAEQAPKKLGALPTTPVLPPPKESRKKLRVFSLDGYFRLRGDWMKQFDLGFTDRESLGGAPFPNPLACRTESQQGCETSFGTANTRLRLEPIIHLDERSTVHMQIDVLDNVVLGSTPEEGLSNPPFGALNDSQRTPQFGLNNLANSIAVKRAWAEVDAPFGLLKFGRQPWHWGMGMVANGGGQDPIHGGYNLDADFGDTVDRVMFSAAVPGTKLNAGLAADWSQTGPTSSQIGEQQGGAGRQSWDMDDSDDLDQWLFMISHMDSPTRVADLLAAGSTVLNYGGFLAYRTQGYEQRGVEGEDLVFGETPPPEGYFKKDLTAYIPDLWVHYAKGKLDIEAEAVAVLGSLKEPDRANTIDIRQFGGVARMRYKLMDDDLTIGFEIGSASGDQWDNEVPGRTHVSGAIGLGPGDDTLEQFIFDRAYHVDLILFRELLGAVTNATYGKPSFKYELTNKFAVSGAGILSFANRPIATPGNASLYGLELDADIGYSNDGFFAGISYGLLLPFAALDHPADGEGGPGFGFGPNIGDAQTAQTIQTRLVLQF